MPISKKIAPKPAQTDPKSNGPKEPKESKVLQNTDHLVPHANRLLTIAGKAAWGMTKLLVGVAIRIPGWFIRANKRHLADRHKTDSAAPGVKN